jgi:hypothetical protein
MTTVESFKLKILSSVWLLPDSHIMVKVSNSSDCAKFCGDSITSDFRKALSCGLADPTGNCQNLATHCDHPLARLSW